jgi:hypothetical protein
LLISGQLRQRATAGNPVILLDSEQPHGEKLVTLWHEIIHLLRMAGGYSQDEEDVEAWAKRLAATCPDALAWVGIHEANARAMPSGDGVANESKLDGMEQERALTDRLRKSAQALVDRWETPFWKDAPHTGKFIRSLDDALVAWEEARK